MHRFFRLNGLNLEPEPRFKASEPEPEPRLKASEPEPEPRFKASEPEPEPRLKASEPEPKAPKVPSSRARRLDSARAYGQHYSLINIFI